MNTHMMNDGGVVLVAHETAYLRKSKIVPMT
jgi:hypothetical protein